MSVKLLSVESLSVDFKVDGQWTSAVHDVSFKLLSGEVLAIVGESGCGKSVTCLSLARLVDANVSRYSSGKILFNDLGISKDVLKIAKKELRKIRGGKIGYIFQEPSVSLNPVFRIGDQIAEAINMHRKGLESVDLEVLKLLKMVGIPDPEDKAYAYPHELSGGMQQRAMIAMALAGKPNILVADEPTTALDVTIQAQIIDLLADIREKTNMAIILVTHNFGIVAELADRVLVMYAGQTVEESSVDNLLDSPKHPYTKALMAAIPRFGHRGETLATIPGTVPMAGDYSFGCRFSDRCAVKLCLDSQRQDICENVQPELLQVEEGHKVRCHFCNVDLSDNL